MSGNRINIAFIDDSKLIRDSVKEFLCRHNPNCKIIIEASGGNDFINQLKDSAIMPDLAIIDIIMPDMNGIETVKWIKENQSSLKTLILTQEVDEANIVAMMRMKVDAFLTKDVEVGILSEAIEIVMKNGKFYQDIIESKYYDYVNLQLNGNSPNPVAEMFTFLDIKFIKAACSELNNKDLGDELGLSESAIEGYCNRVYKKMGVTNRAGMILYAIKNHIVRIDDL